DRLANAYDPNPNVAYDPVTKNPFASFEAETLNRSAYVFDSMELTEKWLLNAGVRYESYRSEIRNQNAMTGVLTDEFENDESFWNYQLGAVYRLQPNGTLYATYATSSSPVGLANGQNSYESSLNLNTEDLAPERSKTFEIGT